LILKILASVLGIGILLLLILKLSGFSFGVRLMGNTFGNQVGGLSVFLWLMILMGLAEMLTLVVLFYQQKASL
jgi:hypothetical protein